MPNPGTKVTQYLRGAMLCLHVKIQQLLGLLLKHYPGTEREIVFSVDVTAIEGESTATIRTVNHDDYAGL